jgi:hypothetical protein
MEVKPLRSTAFLGLLSLSLIGCASLSEIRPETRNNKTDISTKEYTDRLPPQKLPPGQCGLFIWTADTEQTFIGFETDDRVKLILEGQRLEGRRIYKDGIVFPDRIYSLEGGAKGAIEIPVSLVEDKEIAEGTRYYGRFKSLTENGWERLTPIVALYSCVSEA